MQFAYEATKWSRQVDHVKIYFYVLIDLFKRELNRPVQFAYEAKKGLDKLISLSSKFATI